MQPTKKPGNTISGVMLLLLTITALGVFYLAWGLNGAKDLQSNVGLTLLVLAFVMSIGIVAGKIIALKGYTFIFLLIIAITFYEYSTKPKELLISLAMLTLLFSPLIILWVKHRQLFS